MDRTGVQLIVFMSIVSVQLLHGLRIEKRQAVPPEPIECYTCLNAPTNEACNEQGLQTCRRFQTSCQTEIRVHTTDDGRDVRFKKGCKQDIACENNFAQNPRRAWPSTQCNASPVLSVCRYCCTDPGCNDKTPDFVCGSLYAPLNGQANCTGYIRDASCTFKCNKCYRLRGSRARTCRKDGTWSGVEPRCIYDERLPGCDPVDSCTREHIFPPQNGQVVCTDGYQLGSECRYFCDPGYEMKGKDTVRCDEVTKTWDGKKPVCEKLDVEKPCHANAYRGLDDVGKSRCICNDGFLGDGYNCVDIDECAANVGVLCTGYQEKCVNTIGAFICECDSGYERNDINQQCEDIDECVTIRRPCPDLVNSLCINREGTYTCECRTGYMMINNACIETAK